MNGLLRKDSDYEQGQRPRYRSPHWQEPDIVTHLRVDRRDVGGAPALFVEEVQSDWDQAAREKGYKSERDAAVRTATEATDHLRDLLDARPELLGLGPGERASGRFTELQARVRDGRITDPEAVAAVRDYERTRALHEKEYTVADQPFKGTKATELGVKRALLEAVDQGLDQVAWTTGKQQAERYGKLLRDVKRVEFVEPKNGADKAHLLIYTGASGSGGGYAAREIDVSRNEVKQYIGKENAERLLATPAKLQRPGGMTIDGFALDTSENPLTIGSRGMDQQYDETMVAHFNKLGKPYGAKAERVPMASSGGSHSTVSVLEYEEADDEMLSLVPGRGRFVVHEAIGDGDLGDPLFRLESQQQADEYQRTGYWVDKENRGPGSLYRVRTFDNDSVVTRSQHSREGEAREAVQKLAKRADEVWRFTIPEKMRDALATRGLPLLAMAPVGLDEDASLEDRAKALGLGALAVVISGKFGKSRGPAMQKMLDELAKAPANVSRAAKKAGLTGTVEENALALFKSRGHTDSPAGMAQAMKDAGIALPGKTAAEKEAAHAYVKEMLGRAAVEGRQSPESPLKGYDAHGASHEDIGDGVTLVDPGLMPTTALDQAVDKMQAKLEPLSKAVYPNWRVKLALKSMGKDAKPEDVLEALASGKFKDFPDD